MLAVGLATVVVAFNPMSAGAELRAMLGIEQDLTFTITQHGPAAGYAPALRQPGSDEPVTWNPCEQIHYVVNPEGAPPDPERLVAQAVAEIAGASGLRFSYDGSTDDRSFADRSGILGGSPPVLIGWATPQEVPELAGDVAGVGGAEAMGTSPGHLSYVTGMVALDRDGFADLGAGRQVAVLEHELGHVVGLAHVDDPAQLMYAETTTTTRLGDGDRAGLQVLGDGACR